MTKGRPNHWIGTTRTLLLTRQARGDRDPGAALHSIASGVDSAVGLKIRGQRVLLLLDPQLCGQLLVLEAAHTVKGPGVQRTRALLGNGLLTSEGADHTRARRLVAAAFSPSRLAGYTDTFARLSQAHVAAWKDGEQVDMHREMAALTLKIVGQTLLGIDLAEQAPQVRESLESALSRFASTAGLSSRRMLGAAPSVSDIRDADTAHVHRLIASIIEQRRADISTDRADVISALLTSSNAGGLSDTEVHDHVMTLMMAGHETTATALSWTMHLLSEHPDVALLLRSELAQLNGQAPTAATIAGLTYTRAVIAEAMRLYPPAWIIGRKTTSDLVLGDWQVPSGTVVAVSALLLHHDPRYFADPEVFDPQRWLDQRRDDVPRYAYLPFGTGPRACIGEQFAWNEAITLLAVVAGNWSAQTDPNHDVRPQYRVTMRPAEGLPMTVRRSPPQYVPGTTDRGCGTV